jgi:hypothetical protein
MCKARRRKSTSNSQIIKSLNGTLRHLAANGVLPKIYDIKTVLHHRKKTRHKPCLAEVSQGQRLDEFLSKNNIPTEDQASFISVLKEVGANIIGVSDEELVKAIEFVNHERLMAIRGIAERVILEEREHYQWGQRQFDASDLTGAEVRAMITALGDVRGYATIGYQRVFPKENADLALGRFLRLLKHEFGAMIPRRGRDPSSPEFWAKRTQEFGGADAMVGYFTASQRALTAALILYLIDSGANPAVGRTLFIDCLEPSDLSGHSQISGFKARSKGKPIHTDLPETSPEMRVTAVQAIRWILEMTELLRGNAQGEAARMLFLCRGRNDIFRALSEGGLTDGFKAMLAHENIASGLMFLPSMLRPSVLIDSALKNDGAQIEAIIIANHSTSSSIGDYTGKFPVRKLYESKIRQFQKEWQALTLVNIKDISEKLGITREDFEAALHSGLKNGLGVLRGYKTTDKTPTSSCGPGQILVNCSPDRIADLLQIRDLIAAEQETILPSADEAWKKQRLPWQGLIQVVIEHLSTGPGVKVLEEAQLIVGEREKQNVHAPKPWEIEI